MVVKVRMFIAELLDKKDDTCWANLFMWAIGNVDFQETFIDGAWKRQMCRQSCEGTPYAYCGKCEKTGRYYDLPE